MFGSCLYQTFQTNVFTLIVFISETRDKVFEYGAITNFATARDDRTYLETIDGVPVFWLQETCSSLSESSVREVGSFELVEQLAVDEDEEFPDFVSRLLEEMTEVAWTRPTVKF